MFMSKITILDKSIQNRLNNNYQDSSNSYFMHQIIRSLFPVSYKGSLLFRGVTNKDNTIFYVISEIEPYKKKVLEINTKFYSPQISKGHLLHFSLTANPAIVINSDNKKNCIRHDVWMDTKIKAKNAGETTDNIYILCYENTKNWLTFRSNKYGFKIHNLAIDQYVHHSFIKPNDGNKVTYGAVDYRGIIEVIDPDIFVNVTLFKGVGPCKAFGCGLMLIKPHMM